MSLCRRTPMRRGKPLSQGTKPLRRVPIKRSAPKEKPSRQSTGFSAKVRRTIRTRSGGWCEFPFCPKAAEHQHHRRARGSGGSSDPQTNEAANGLDLCSGHHMWIESHRAAARVFGLLVRQGVDPATVPAVTRHCPDPVLLDNEGGWRRVDG